MKVLFGVLFGVFLLAAIGFGVGAGVRGYLYNVRIGQYLKLADDASLPAMKRDFLEKYKEAVNGNIRGEDARYIFKQGRLTKKTQLANLDSLITRLSDLAKMPPDSLPYQQGMQQITGQEFDHTSAEINGVFFDCYTRDSFMGRFAVVPLTGIFALLCIVAGIGLAATFDF
jgi:hypothetical protein